MRVDLWSDLACPRCALGLAHLDQALAQFEHADETYVLWRSFPLHPAAPAQRGGSHEELPARARSTPGGRAAAEHLAVAAGAPARPDLVRPPSTVDAHRLLHLAKVYGVQDDLARRFLRASLADGAPLSDHPTLQAHAEAVGLAPAEVARVLRGSAFGDAVRADRAEAARRGTTAVPTLLLAGSIVSQAQTADSVLAALRRAWATQQAHAAGHGVTGSARVVLQAGGSRPGGSVPGREPVGQLREAGRSSNAPQTTSSAT